MGKSHLNAVIMTELLCKTREQNKDQVQLFNANIRYVIFK